MAVTSDGELLLADHSNNCIRSVSRQKTISTLFTTSGTPSGLCCFPNKNIVVTLHDERNVKVYNIDGEIIQTFDHITFRCPRTVAVNKVNQDIYICDERKVLAVGADGRLQYEYTGQGDREFTPYDVCTDQMGHVFIADRDNDRVHVLDQEGRFIQYILTSQQGLGWPVTTDVDREGYLWVGKQVGPTGYVEVARYLQ